MSPRFPDPRTPGRPVDRRATRLSAPRILLLTTALFLGLAAAVALPGELPGDVALRDAILAAASPATVSALRVANLLGEGAVVIPALVLVVLLTPRARRQWWVWLSLVATVPLAEALVKELMARPRPETMSFGFPSGHAMAAGAFFGAVAWLATGIRRAAARRSVWALALAAIVLVALARVVLRAHWPSDALAGASLGLALATATLLVDEVRGRSPGWRASRRAPAPRSPRAPRGETAWR
jgi:undecaprenyl-diphosphatase